MLPYIYVAGRDVSMYGVCMAIGIAVAFTTAAFRVKKRKESIDTLLEVAAVALALALFGAKLAYYIFSYGIVRLISEIFSGDFHGFELSGLVWYGGLFGGLVGAYVAMRFNHVNSSLYLNATVPCIPLGHAFGRIGCLFAGCCYGLYYDGEFAIHSVYVNPAETLFPIQALESSLNLILFIIFSIYTNKERNGMVTLFLYFILYSIIRFILEFFRGDIIRGFYLGLSTSQWISAFLFIVSIIVIALNRRGKFQSNRKNVRRKSRCQ